MSARVRAALERALAVLARDHGLASTAESQDRLIEYVAALHEYNRIHRVVGARTPEEIAEDLVVDALGLWPLVRSPLVDVGSGAGLPGLVLKLAAPELQVTLIEPRQKPVAFQASMRARFALRDLQLIDRRAQDTEVKDLAGGQPAAMLVAKGFGAVDKLMRAAGHLLEPGGTALVAASTREPESRDVQVEAHPLLSGRWVHTLRRRQDRPVQ